MPEFVRFHAELTGINAGESFVVPLSYVTDRELWRLWPVINCDRTEDMPVDYPGVVGAPVTSMTKPLRENGWVVVDAIRPKMPDGTAKYWRILWRNTRPSLPPQIDIAEMLRQTGRALVLATVPLDSAELTGGD